MPGRCASSTPTCTVIVQSPLAERVLDICTVEREPRGRAVPATASYVETLPPGRYAFWKNVADVKVVPGRPARADARRRRPGDHDGRQGHAADERRGDLPRRRRPAGGQRRRTTSRQALYREAQLALRAVVGARELDAFLTDKDARGAASSRSSVRRRVPATRSGGRLGRHPRRHPAGRDEGPDEQGDGGQEGGRGQPDRPPRGNGRHAQPGQHGQAAGRTTRRSCACASWKSWKRSPRRPSSASCSATRAWPTASSTCWRWNAGPIVRAGDFHAAYFRLASRPLIAAPSPRHLSPCHLVATKPLATRCGLVKCRSQFGSDPARNGCLRGTWQWVFPLRRGFWSAIACFVLAYGSAAGITAEIKILLPRGQGVRNQ